MESSAPGLTVTTTKTAEGAGGSRTCWGLTALGGDAYWKVTDPSPFPRLMVGCEPDDNRPWSVSIRGEDCFHMDSDRRYPRALDRRTEDGIVAGGECAPVPGPVAEGSQDRWLD
ncbi:hypothetical protein JCM18882A_00880 [Brevibacterium metallidurans]|uniref:Uncharacterized protein n=1 Tax=Brevibacterium metallidurans TaxID=1482676 RepID=A0ABN0SIJ8_9MICO